MPPGRAREASDLKLQLMASMNHEIRTPLSGILGMADLLLETTLDDEQRSYVAAARECAQNLHELLNTTLEYTSVMSGCAQLDESEFDLREVLNSAVVEMQHKATLQEMQIAWNGCANLPRVVVGDGYRTRQVFTLLLSTALRLSTAGALSTEAICALGVRPDTLLLSLSVRNTSTSLADWQLQELLESTRQNDLALTRRFSELGLSLSLLRRILEMMGGQLTLETGASCACALTAELPLRIREVRPAKDAAALENPNADARILVVDDNRIALRVITAILGKGQYRCDCAESAEEALDMAAQHPYSLILMDLQMPGMDGLEATARMRLIPGYAQVPILALTADVSDEVRLQCRKSGMAAFLNKPVHAAELLSAVEHWVS